MSDELVPPEFAPDSGGSGNRPRRIAIGAPEPGGNRPLILYEEACDEALMLGETLLDTEHFLLALARYEKEISAKALLLFGLDLEIIRSVAQSASLGQAESSGGKLIMTPRARSAQDGAWEEAARLQHISVGPEHLLLAILHQKVGIASRILDEFDVDRKELRFQILKLMRVGND